MKIILQNITKSFNSPSGDLMIFENLNINISSNEFVSILGPNGCGKTTLLNLINGIDKDYSGLIKIKSKNNKQDFAYMMQKDLLLPWRTVYKNIVIGLEIDGRMNSHTRDLVLEYLDKFGISNLIDSYPMKLSGGERQKVALVRTLILDSEILLLDEPFSSIDYNTRLELQSKFYHLAKERNKTVLLITHDIDEAIAVSDRVIIFNQKPYGINKDFKLKMDIENRSPITTRQHSDFAKYFNLIWNSLPKNNNK